MAVLPTFTQPQAPDTGEEIQLQSANDAQNWMTQAAQRQQIGANVAQTQQQTDEQNTQFQTMLPALVAKANADRLNAQNDADAATLTQQLKGQWSSLKPQVIQDLAQIHDPNNIPKEADGTPDWNAIYNNYEGLQAKYGALSLFPEGKPYYDMIDQAKKVAAEQAAKHNQMQLILAQQKNQAQLMLNNKVAGQDNQAALQAQNKPAIAQTEATNTQRNQAFTDISSQRDLLDKTGFTLANLRKDVGNEQNSMLGSGPIVGSSAMGMFRPSVKQVQSDIGDFATQIMSTVKNLKNINEFRAVTANLVHADDQAPVQNEKLDRLDTILQIARQRNDFKEQALRADPVLQPDQADQQATNKYPFPSSIIGPIVTEKPPASLSPQDSEALEWAKTNPKDPRSAAILQHLGTLP